MKKPILLLDFDGVIHSYASGWKGADIIPDDPVPGAFEFIEAAMEKFDVQVYSARSCQLGGVWAMRRWFDRHNFQFTDYLKFPIEKPPAFLTIDDRCIRFVGEWPSIPDLVGFKAWHEQ